MSNKKPAFKCRCCQSINKGLPVAVLGSDESRVEIEIDGFCDQCIGEVFTRFIGINLMVDWREFLTVDEKSPIHELFLRVLIALDILSEEEGHLPRYKGKIVNLGLDRKMISFSDRLRVAAFERAFAKKMEKNKFHSK